MSITRRTMLAGLGGVGVGASLPAWAQVIRAQNDPWAQVDPYDDPRNGFPAQGTRPAERPASTDGVFQRAPLRKPSPEEEKAEILTATQSYADNLEDEGGPVHDARVQRAIGEFVGVLTKKADRSHLPWQATVARNLDINAWAMGGGKLCFNAGLIEMCDHPAELAAVAAHEIGHVDCLHQVMRKQMERTLAEADQAGMLGLGKVAAGTLVPGAEAMKRKTSLDLLRAGFSRENEFEADEHSIEVMRRAGLDPSWAVVMMTKLERFGYEHGHHLINPLLPSHPPSRERVANLARHVAINSTPVANVSMPGWDVLKAVFPTPAKWRNT